MRCQYLFYQVKNENSVSSFKADMDLKVLQQTSPHVIKATSMSLNWPQSTYRSVPSASLCYSVCHYARIFQDKWRSKLWYKGNASATVKSKSERTGIHSIKGAPALCQSVPRWCEFPLSSRSENNKTCLHVDTASCFTLSSSLHWDQGFHDKLLLLWLVSKTVITTVAPTVILQGNACGSFCFLFPLENAPWTFHCNQIIM